MKPKETIELLTKMSEDTTRFTKEERNAFLCGRSAIEKQIPKHPDYEGDGYDDNGELIYDTAYCPYCREDYEVERFCNR